MPVRHIAIKPFTWIYASLSMISRCDIDIYMGAEKAVVVAGQLPENQDPGISVTDGAALIAATIMHKYGFPLDGLVWMECDAKDSLENGGSGATYRRVFFRYRDGELLAERREAVDPVTVAQLTADPDSTM